MAQALVAQCEKNCCQSADLTKGQNVIPTQRSTFSASRALAFGQVALGFVAFVLVLIGYFLFSDRISIVLSQLDNMTKSAATELDIAIQILDDVDIVLGHVEVSMPQYRKTLSSLNTSLTQIDGVLLQWKDRGQSASTIANDLAVICDTFEKQLPISIPTAKLNTRDIVVDTPTFAVATAEHSIEYVAGIRTSKDEVRQKYVSGASVETDTKRFGRVAGKDLGSIDYPSGLKVEKDEIRFRFVNGIEPIMKSQTFSVPTSVNITHKEVKLSLPESVEITTRELMKDEKAAAQKIATELRATSAALQDTLKTFEEVHADLTANASSSLSASIDNLDAAVQALTKLRSERVKSISAELKNQRESLEHSRDFFKMLQSAIPFLFIIVALIPCGQMLSGMWKVLRISAV